MNTNTDGIQLKLVKDNPAYHTIYVINVYAPTSSVAKKDEQELKILYDELRKLELEKL